MGRSGSERVGPRGIARGQKGERAAQGDCSTRGASAPAGAAHPSVIGMTQGGRAMRDDLDRRSGLDDRDNSVRMLVHRASLRRLEQQAEVHRRAARCHGEGGTQGKNPTGLQHRSILPRPRPGLR